MRIWQLLFLASLAALPVQLGKFFFIRDSYVLGLPIDYLAITIYLSDLVIVATIASYLWSLKKRWKKTFAQHRPYIVTAAIFVLYLFTLTFLANPISPTALNFSIRVVLLFLYSLAAADFFSAHNLTPAAKKVVNFSLLWVSLLIIAEFTLQRSLNLWFLGERSFDTSTSNIAHFSLSGQQFLRGYGTFSHPNVAGAFLVIYLILSFSLPGHPELKREARRALSISGSTLLSFPRKRESRNRPSTGFRIKSGMIISIALVALLLTFSKAAIFALLLYILLAFTNRKISLAIFSLFAAAAFILVSAQQLIPIDSIAERLSLSQAALDISLKNPLFGVGPTNFIRELAKLNLYSISQTRLLQPVHNIFLTFLVETGITGLFLFAAVLFTVAARATNKTKQALFIVLLCFASIDHFFITIHQGQLLLWLALGYILSRDRPAKNSKH
jgi:O-antigen ligase